MQIEIGIMNCVTGKTVRKKTVEQEVALEEGQKVSKWLDRQDTFFSTVVWKYWKSVGIVSKFESLINGDAYDDIATEHMVVFKKNSPRGEEHEFYMKRRK